MLTIQDKILGSLEYHHLWKGECEVKLWGKLRTLIIEAQSSEGETITEAQRQGFTLFNNRLNDINSAHSDVENYCSSDLASLGIAKFDLLSNVIPRSVFLPRDGGFGLLCDYTYDEHGIAIFCTSPHDRLQVGPEDAIL